MNSEASDGITSFPRETILDLEAQVQRRLTGRLRAFRLEVQAGGLTLLGAAPTYYTKQLAQHFIMEATRIPIVANRIEVP